MDNDFLPYLPKHLARNVSRSRTVAPVDDEWYFLIDIDDAGRLWLSTVDKNRNPLTGLDYHAYSGPKAALLRMMARVEADSRFDVSWDDEDKGVELSRHPMLVYQLVNCDNVIASGHGHVRLSPSFAVVTLVVKPKDSADGMLESAWYLRLPDTSGDEGIAGQDDDAMRSHYVLLSDSFVLCGSVIYPIEPLGDNYADLKFFASSFPSSMVENYLSVVYSYVDSFALDYDGRVVETSADPIEMRPVIIFEKVDSDKALHLRVSTGVRGMEESFIRRFELSKVVSIAIDGKVSVRKVTPRDVRDDIASVRSLISKYAPSRKEAKEVYLDGDTFIIPASVAGPFLLQGLQGLLGDYMLYGAERLRDYKVVFVKPRLNLKVSSGIDFLEGEATVQIADETVDIGRLIEQYRRDRYVMLKDGSRAVLDDAYMRKLGRMFGDKRNAGKKVRLSYFDLSDIDDLLSVKLDPSLLSRPREVYEGFGRLSVEGLKFPALNAELRRYQVEGVAWIKYLYDNSLGGCLADDMGLGKTIQTIAMLSTVYPSEPRPSLIVMPRSLLFNWQNELRRFCPSLSVYTYYLGERDMAEAMKHNVVITTYAMVRNDIEKFSKESFHYIILDESQNIKNISAMVTHAVYLLNGSHRLALSGTPIENNLSELYSLFRFLNPGMLGDPEEFNRRYAGPIQHDDDKEAMASLRRRIYPFMLRRLKKDVLTELPDRIQQTLYTEMEQAQAEYYEQRRRYYQEKVNSSIAAEGVGKSQFVMFQALTELRRIASVPESLTEGEIHSPKLDVLVDSIAEAVANNHKCVVFFNYIAGLELTGARLSERGIGYEVMTGATADRRRTVEHFTNDASCRVFLMTLKTGGVGLNLTVADTVFIYEPWWNKAAEEQAVNRLHRFGQKAKVLSYSLITRGTIEEKILQLQERKSQLFDSLIGSDVSSAKQLSEEDINFILGR